MVLPLDEAGEPIGENLPEHLSFEIGVGNPLDHHTHEDLRQIAAQWGEEAKRNFDESIAKLAVITRACSPLALLSHFAFYDTAHYENYSGESDYSPAEQHQVEILQALVLAIPENEVRNDDPTPEQRMEVNALLRSVSKGFSLKRLAANSGLANLVREQTRSGTQIVRNPGSQGQILRNLKELFAPLDSQLFQSKRVTFTGLIAVCEGFTEQIVSRLNAHRRALQLCFKQPTREAMIDEFGGLFHLPPAFVTSFKQQDALHSTSVKETRTALFNLSEQVFSGIFSTKLDDLITMYPGGVDRAALEKAISEWSLKLGSLQTTQTEHLFLANPIWSKPIIELSAGHYFWPVFSLFVSFGLEMLEAQFEGNQALKDAYHDRRSDFTEERTAELLSDLAPGARMLRNLEWRDGETGKDLENDILILIDKHAFIVECKSGRIKDAARRGGQSLDESLRKLIQEPTEQGYRFEQFLCNQSEPMRLKDKRGTSHEVDPTAILSYTRVNVLLDFWGPLACQDKLLRQAGIINTPALAAVSLALVDLENLLYLIESPAQRIHYLHHRADLERTFEIIGDELDLIAYYLGGGRWPADPNTKMSIVSASSHVDPFLRRRDLGLSKRIPKLKLNQWWTDMLQRMEAKVYAGWTEAAIVLLSFPLENQNQYRSLVESTINDTIVSSQQTQGREIICAAYPTAGGMMGFATHVTSRGTWEENRAKLGTALQALADMDPQPKRLLAVTVFPDSYPYENLGVARP
jgi:hypothetical protein